MRGDTGPRATATSCAVRPGQVVEQVRSTADLVRAR